MAFDKKEWTKKYNNSEKAKKAQKAWYKKNIERDINKNSLRNVELFSLKCKSLFTIIKLLF